MSDFGIKRKFRFDYFIEMEDIVVEVNGGNFMMGRHNFGKGYENDLMKSNLSQSIGLKYYQFTYPMLMRLEYKLFL